MASEHDERETKWAELHVRYIECVNALGKLMQAGFGPQEELFKARKDMLALEAANEMLREELKQAKGTTNES